MPPRGEVQDAPQTNATPRPNSGVLSHEDAVVEPHWTPQTVLATIPSHSQPKAQSSSPIPFFHLLHRLKTTKREGWRRFGIDHGESISDHMYRMSILTMCVPPSLSTRLDISRCVKMALVHDMAELLVGDITPVDGVPKSEKSRRESETIDYLCETLLGNVDGGVQGAEIKSLWREYEDQTSEESVLVHDIDKMELVLQMLDYEKNVEGALDLGEFSWVRRKIVSKEIQAWCDEVLRERDSFWKSQGKSYSRFDIDQDGSQARGQEREQQQENYYSKEGGQA